jgi:hypothetical protein
VDHPRRREDIEAAGEIFPVMVVMVESVAACPNSTFEINVNYLEILNNMPGIKYHI